MKSKVILRGKGIMKEGENAISAVTIDSIKALQIIPKDPNKLGTIYPVKDDTVVFWVGEFSMDASREVDVTITIVAEDDSAKDVPKGPHVEVVDEDDGYCD